MSYSPKVDPNATKVSRIEGSEKDKDEQNSVTSVAKDKMTTETSDAKAKPKASLGWGTTILGWAGAQLLGKHDQNDTSVADHQKQLAALLGSHKMNQTIHEMASSWITKLEEEMQGGWFEGYVRTEKQLMQDIIEVNILHALVNLTTQLKKNNPNLDLAKIDLFEEIMNLVAKETNTEIATIRKEIQKLEIECKKQIEEAEKKSDEKSKNAILAQLKRMKQDKMAFLSNKILQMAFPNGKADIILPSSKKGWIDVTGILYSLIQGQLPNLFFGFTEKLNTASEVHDRNLEILRQFEQGDELIRIGKVLTNQLDRLINRATASSNKDSGELGKLANHLSSYSEIIAMHILAHAASGGNRQVVTSIFSNLISEVIEFAKNSQGNVEEAVKAYRAQMKKIDSQYPAESPERKKAILAAKKEFNKTTEPLTNVIKMQLGVDKQSLKSILPDKFDGILNYIVGYTIGSVPDYFSDMIGSFFSDFILEFCLGTVYPVQVEPGCKERMLGYDEISKTFDGTINELMPTINLSIADSGSDIGKGIISFVNELLLGKYQADASLFEVPIRDLVASDYMFPVESFGQEFIKRTLVSLFANLANSNPDFEPFPKVEMLSAAILHIIRIANEQIGDVNKLAGKIGWWKQQMQICEQLPAGSVEQKTLKAELALRKEELLIELYPCANAILVKGGWRDPENIHVPNMLKDKLKNAMAQTVLPELLFSVFADTLAFDEFTEEEQKQLRAPERVDAFAGGLMHIAAPSIQATLAESSALFAEQINKKMTHSSLELREEAVVAGQLQGVFSSNNRSMRQFWGGFEGWLIQILSNGLKRLSLTSGLAGDALSNAMMQIKRLIVAQNIDPNLIETWVSYRKETLEIKALDKKISKLKENAIEQPEYQDEIKVLIQERRHKFLELHQSIYAKQKGATEDDKQMELVRDLTKIEALRNEVESIREDAYEKIHLINAFQDYKTLVNREVEVLKYDTSADAKKKLYLKERELRHNEFLASKSFTKSELLAAIKSHEDSLINTLEQTAPIQKLQQSLVAPFKPLAEQILNQMGFKNAKDLPVPFFLQPIVWDLLRNDILPDLFLDFYSTAWAPSLELQQAQEQLVKSNADQLFALNTFTSGASHFVTESLKDVSCGEEPSLPKLIAETLAEQGIGGMDEAWLTKFFSDLGNDYPLWGTLRLFLRNRIEYLTYSGAKDAAPRVNLLHTILGKLVKPIGDTIKTNSQAIDRAVLDYEAAPVEEKKKLKQVLAHELFGSLIDTVFNETGLDQSHAFGVALFGQTIAKTLKTTFEGFCFDLVYDSRFARLKLNTSKDDILKAVAKENGMSPQDVTAFAELIDHSFIAAGLQVKEVVKETIQDHTFPQETAASIVKTLYASDEDLTWYSDAVEDMIYQRESFDFLESLPDLVHAILMRKLIAIANSTAAPEGQSSVKYLPRRLIESILASLYKHREAYRNSVAKAYEENPQISEEELKKKLKKESMKVVDDLMTGIQVDASHDFMPFTQTLWNSIGKGFLADYITATYLKSTKASRSGLGNKLEDALAIKLNIKTEDAKTLRGQIDHSLATFGVKIEKMILNALGKIPVDPETIVGINKEGAILPEIENNWKKARHGQWALMKGGQPGTYQVIKKVRYTPIENCPVLPVQLVSIDSICSIISEYNHREFVRDNAESASEKLLENSPAKRQMEMWLETIIDGLTLSPEIDRLIQDVPGIVHEIILKKLVDLSPKPSNIILVLLDSLNRHRLELNQIVQNHPGLTDGELKKKLSLETTKIVDELFKQLGVKPSDDIPIPFSDQLWNKVGKTVVADMLAQMYLDSNRVYKQAAEEQIKPVISQEELRSNVKNMFGMLGKVIRDSVKIQLGLMPNTKEKIVGLKDGKIVPAANRKDHWNQARPGEWALIESKSLQGIYSLVLKTKGKTSKESPKIKLLGSSPSSDEIHQAIAQYRNTVFSQTTAQKLMQQMQLDSLPLTNWMTGGVKETVNSVQLQQLLYDLPEMVQAIIMNKLAQLANTQGMPVKPKAGESPVSVLPANIAITVLNAIESRREILKKNLKAVLDKKPNISNEELEKELLPEFITLVDALFDDLKFDPESDIPVPFADTLWNSVGKTTLAEMMANVYVGMSKNVRQKHEYKRHLDERFEDKLEDNKTHVPLVEATKAYAGFAMKYLKNMLVFKTPGIDGALDALDLMLREQGDNETVYFLEKNREAAKQWLIDNNLKPVAKSKESGVRGTLFPAAEGSLRAVMLKIFDNFTGNIARIEDQDPDVTLNFALNMMDLVAEHLGAIADITNKQGKKYMHQTDPVLMAKAFADKGLLHEDMPGYQWQKAIMQTQAEIEQLQKETPVPQDKLQAAKIRLADLQAEAETKLKEGTYKKMTSYLLTMAGYTKPEDLTEVPEAVQGLIWDALNQSLGPEIIQTIFGKAFETNMLNSHLLKLMQIINRKIAESESTGSSDELSEEGVEMRGFPTGITQRQARCKQLIQAVVTVMPLNLITELTKLDKIGDLAAAQLESIVRESLKEWSMLNIIEEALTTGAASLPEEPLPETEAGLKAAELKAQNEAAVLPSKIKDEAAQAVNVVKKSIWMMLRTKWIILQRTIDQWIRKHDVGGVFTAIKKVLDAICRLIFFDIIGTIVHAIFWLPVEYILYLYKKYKIKHDIEHARKMLVDVPIHQNLGLKGLDEFMEQFPAQ